MDIHHKHGPIGNWREFAKELADLPKLYNGGLLPTAEVARMGFQVMIYFYSMWGGSILPISLIRAWPSWYPSPASM